jgi:hypothetical protein
MSLPNWQARSRLPGLGDASGHDEVLAWEIAVLRRGGRESETGRLHRACVKSGAIAGFVPAALVFAVYVFEAWEWGMPWLRIASVVAVFAPIAGVLLAGCVEVMVMWSDRVARAWWPLRVIANPLMAGLVGGVVAGIGPGAVGVPVFGSYSGPFLGTPELACACIGAAALVVVPAARRSGVRRIAVALGLATVIAAAMAAVVTPVVVDEAFAQIGDGLQSQGAMIGAVCGAIAGGFLGLYVGLVIVLGRVLDFGWRDRARRIE